MDLTPPPLTRSPSTPSHSYCSSSTSSIGYPSPGMPVVDQQYGISSMYGDHGCSVPSMDSEPSLRPLDSMSQSWNDQTVMQPSSSGAGVANLLSTGEYEFSNYPYNTHVIYHPHGHGHPVRATTPPPTAARCRVPSTRTCISYSSAGSPIASTLTLRGVKAEGPGSEYAQGMDMAHYPSPRSVPMTYQTDGGTYTSTSSGYLSDNGSSWSRSDYQSLEPEHFYPAPPSQTSQTSHVPQTSPFLEDARRQYRVARPKRAPRRLTTKEEANFQCAVKDCGKLFSRSYNYKAHMETHDDQREYPFPCPLPDCNKRFVRKTDLQRHHQSVHLKERKHKCDYCNRLFARKDTLRRHMEDGCSKRFDIGTLDLRADAYDALPPAANSSMRPMAPMSHLMTPARMPPMMPPLSNLPSMSMRGRDLLTGGDQFQGHNHNWGP